jgi:hypothetical protein
MSGVDPHMISGTWDWFGLTESSMVSPLVKSTLRNGLCGVIEVWFWMLRVCLDIQKLLVEYNHCLLRVKTLMSATLV